MVGILGKLFGKFLKNNKCILNHNRLTPTWSKQVNEECCLARQKVGILFRKYCVSISTLLYSALPLLHKTLIWSMQWQFGPPIKYAHRNQFRSLLFESFPGSGILTTTLSMPDTTFPVYLKHGCSYDSAFRLNVINGTYSLPDPSPIELANAGSPLL